MCCGLMVLPQTSKKDVYDCTRNPYTWILNAVTGVFRWFPKLASQEESPDQKISLFLINQSVAAAF